MKLCNFCHGVVEDEVTECTCGKSRIFSDVTTTRLLDTRPYASLKPYDKVRRRDFSKMQRRNSVNLYGELTFKPYNIEGSSTQKVTLGIGPKLGKGGEFEVFKCLDGESCRHVFKRPIKQGYSSHNSCELRSIILSCARQNKHIISDIPVSQDTHEGRYAKGFLSKRLETSLDKELCFCVSFYNSMAIYSILYGALTALATLHKNDVVHCDISPSNLMINSNGDVCLIDYGVAKKKNSLLKQGYGKPVYAAPEVAAYFANKLTGKKNHADTCVALHKDDIWALGVTALELYTWQNPIVDIISTQETALISPFELIARVGNLFDNISSLTSSLVDDYSYEFPPDIELMKLIKKMVCFYPDLRITAEQALEEECMKNYKRLPEYEKEKVWWELIH